MDTKQEAQTYEFSPIVHEKFPTHLMPSGSGLTSDPMANILACFQYLPEQSLPALFQDFRNAANSNNLRSLLDAISDWAATAELYANPPLRAEVEEARAGRKGIEDWLPLR